MYNDSVNLFIARLQRDCPGAGLVFKKDVLAVIEAVSGDPMHETRHIWERVYNTRLYRTQSGAYCRLLEYIAEPLPDLFVGVMDY